MPTDHDGDAASARSAILDTVEATARVLGNGALYLRMLRRFGDDHPPAATPIRAALDSGDLNLAHRLAHTLKGSAGMIGAHRLHAHASALEQRLRVAGADAASELDQVEHDLRDVLLAVQRLLDGQPVMGHDSPTTPAVKVPLASAALLGQLAVLLDTGDGAALDLLAQSAPALKAALGATGFSEVMLAANAFDFEAALAALRGARPDPPQSSG